MANRGTGLRSARDCPGQGSGARSASRMRQAENDRSKSMSTFVCFPIKRADGFVGHRQQCRRKLSVQVCDCWNVLNRDLVAVERSRSLFYFVHSHTLDGMSNCERHSRLKIILWIVLRASIQKLALFFLSLHSITKFLGWSYKVGAAVKNEFANCCNAREMAMPIKWWNIDRL